MLHYPQWIYEPKFDGFRGLLYVSGRECYIRSKRNKVLSRFRELALRIGASSTPVTPFSTARWSPWTMRAGWISGPLLAGKGWLHYAAFDLLWLNGKDLRAQQLIKRKRRLEQLIPANNSTHSRVLAVEEHGRELFEAAQRLDLEGIVAKQRSDPYSPQTIWYKIKNPVYTQAEGRRDLFHKPR